MKKQDDFRDMLRVYLNKYRGMSVTYLEFRLTFNDWIRQNYAPADAEAAIAKVDWDAWVLQPGAIPAVLDFSTPNATVFADIASDYIARNGDSSAINATLYKQTTDPNLKVIMLDNLVAQFYSVTPKIMTKIDSDLSVTDDKNPEMGQRWFPLAIKMGYTSAFPAAKTYAQTIGRQKYIIPVYTALVRNGYRNLAYQWYNERKTFYHPITAKKIRAIIFSSIEVPHREWNPQGEDKFLN
jgi:leukotriene-A4 hydrolase